jgi:hypothetical protein
MYIYEIKLANKISGSFIEIRDTFAKSFRGVFHTNAFRRLKKLKRKMDRIEVRRVYKKKTLELGTRVVSDILYEEE